MERVWLQMVDHFYFLTWGKGVLAGRPTDFNGTGLDASLETFLTNLEGGGC